jgi:hypothetical protein
MAGLSTTLATYTFFFLRISELVTFVSKHLLPFLEKHITVGEVTMRHVDVANDASP